MKEITIYIYVMLVWTGIICIILLDRTGILFMMPMGIVYHCDIRICICNICR